MYFLYLHFLGISSMFKPQNKNHSRKKQRTMSLVSRLQSMRDKNVTQRMK